MINSFLFKILILLTFLNMPMYGITAEASQTGFLVVAGDRGAVGNREVETVFNKFSRDYFATLTFIGWEEDKYSSYFNSALKEIKNKGAGRVVVIPLMISSHDPHFRKMERLLTAQTKEVFGSNFNPVITPPLKESYLFDQILFDHIQIISKDMEQERLVVVGFGVATQEDSDKMKEDLHFLLNRVRRFWNFKETTASIFFHPYAEKKVKEGGDEAALQLITRTAAKKGRTLVIPMSIGMKTDSAMSFSGRLKGMLSELDITMSHEELIQHENILLWLKKTANQYDLSKPGEIGVVLMPHGSNKLWNDTVEKTIEPLKDRYPIEIAYGMADYSTIQEAVSRLEARGIRRIIFGRMYALQESMKAESDYILGLSREPVIRRHHSADFRQLRSSAVFTTFGGYEEDPNIASVLLERVNEMSRNPEKETVLLISHGSGDDELNKKWLSIMGRNVENMKKASTKRFKSIKAATLREDWPDKMKDSLMEIKQIIEEGSRDGRVIIIPNRLAESGFYREVLEGFHFDMNPNGIAPHHFVTEWLEREIKKAINDIGVSPLTWQRKDDTERVENKIVHDKHRF